MLQKLIVLEFGKIPKQALIGSNSNGYVYQYTKMFYTCVIITVSFFSCYTKKDCMQATIVPLSYVPSVFQAREAVLEQFSTLIIVLATRLGPLQT